MLSPDLQRIKHIRDYCVEVERTIARYGNSFDIFDHDPDYQRSVSFCILQIGELSGGLSQGYRQKTAKYVQWGADQRNAGSAATHFITTTLPSIKCRFPLLRIPSLWRISGLLQLAAYIGVAVRPHSGR